MKTCGYFVAAIEKKKTTGISRQLDAGAWAAIDGSALKGTHREARSSITN
jgi:hypothetical protein